MPPSASRNPPWREHAQIKAKSKKIAFQHQRFRTLLMWRLEVMGTYSNCEPLDAMDVNSQRSVRTYWAQISIPGKLLPQSQEELPFLIQFHFFLQAVADTSTGATKLMQITNLARSLEMLKPCTIFKPAHSRLGSHIQNSCLWKRTMEAHNWIHVPDQNDCAKGAKNWKSSLCSQHLQPPPTHLILENPHRRRFFCTIHRATTRVSLSGVRIPHNLMTQTRSDNYGIHRTLCRLKGWAPGAAKERRLLGLAVSTKMDVSSSCRIQIAAASGHHVLSGYMLLGMKVTLSM